MITLIIYDILAESSRFRQNLHPHPYLLPRFFTFTFFSRYSRVSSLMLRLRQGITSIKELTREYLLKNVNVKNLGRR